jgi:hypothetical protein
VLSYFDPGTLRPYGKFKRRTAKGLLQLVSDSVVDYDPKGQIVWRLRLDIRRLTLEKLGGRRAFLNALSFNPRQAQGDLLQKILGEVIKGKLRPLNTLSREDIAATLQVCEWFAGLIVDLPSQKDLRTRLELLDLFSPFSTLAGEHFQGRGPELQRLERFVSSPKSHSYAVVHGIGGSGKSTLVSRFILDHSVPTSVQNWFPFVYSDFDRPALLPHQPWTLLIDALAQLELQFPEHRQAFASLRAKWQSALVSEPIESMGTEILSESQALIYQFSLPAYIDEFVNQLAKASLTRLIWVLDTFEEVQYQGHTAVRGLLSFLDTLSLGLRNRGVEMSPILVTRSDPKIENSEVISIGELDPDAALGFLKSHGITQSQWSSKMVKSIGGNPLTLTLLVELIRREGRSASRRLLVFDATQEVLQGHLYRRILGHIHDREVRKLAHPGLVLRKINPEVIMKILAEPCGLKVNTRSDAERLFAELRREDTLVYLTEDGSLAHREEIRSVMLDLLTKDAPQQVQKIRELAIEFYSQRQDLPSRAEELFHRLCLRQEDSILDSRWIDGAERYLVGSISELPDGGKVYVASRADLDLDEDIWKQASVNDWERRAERRATELLSHGLPEDALVILRERTERTPGTRLWLLEAQANERLHRRNKALECIKKGLKEAEASGNGPLLIDHLLFYSALEAQARRYTSCSRLMADAQQIALELHDLVRSMQIGLDRLVLIKPSKTISQQEKALMGEQLADLFKLIPTSNLLQNLELVFDLAAELGSVRPRLARRVLRDFGLPTNLQPKTLVDFMVLWERELKSQRTKPALAEYAGIKTANNARSAWAEFVNREGISHAALRVRSFSEVFVIEDRASVALAKIYRRRSTPSKVFGTSISKGKKLASKKSSSKSLVRDMSDSRKGQELTSRSRSLRRIRSSRFASRRK